MLEGMSQLMSQAGLPPMSGLTWMLAALPIIVVLGLMIGLGVSGSRSGVIAWIVSVLVILFAFGGDVHVLATGTLKGLWSTLFVLFIVWSSMFLYNIVEVTGSFKVIAHTFTKLTNGNKMLQLLLIGWCFTTFVQGVCGFGVPVAVATPLLIGLGFDPMTATITSLLGHSWGITFGSLGASYSVLINLSPVDPHNMAVWGGVFIAVGGVLTGFAILLNYGGLKALKEGIVAVISLSLVMGVSLMAITSFVSPYIATFIAGALGLAFGSFVLPKFPQYRPAADADAIEEPEEVKGKKFGDAFSAYVILIVVVFAVYLIPPVKNFLEQDIFQVGLAFDEIATTFGYTEAAVAKYSPLKILTTPGSLIVLSSFLAAAYYKSKGLLPQNALGIAWNKTLKQSIGSTATIMPMTMMALTMTAGGLTTYLAYGIASVAGNFFPILSPFIGLLGGFVTSSGTSSNILFTSMQYEVADILKISPFIILALQTTASSLSNSFSPGNAALGTGVSGLSGREGEILKVTGIINVIQSLVIGIMGYLLISAGMGL
ncbi:L-lactate permease [Allofustis seminis]|uniref:L-lactate permease n=1 Tax=Allofustis seminis TaxID=166939 RepID=UPI00037494AB|nr:L-lactate permease [Allofustis seminis]